MKRTDAKLPYSLDTGATLGNAADNKTLLGFFPYFIAACAAARRAIGTRNGLQLTLLNPIRWANSTEAGSPPCSPHIPSSTLGFLVRANATHNCIIFPTPDWSPC